MTRPLAAPPAPDPARAATGVPPAIGLAAALARAHADVVAISPADGFGLLTPVVDGQAVLHARHAWGTAAYHLSADEVPEPLRSRPTDVTQVSAALSLTSALQSAHLLSPGEMRSVVVAPLDGGALFWCASPDPTPLGRDRLEAHRAIGVRVLEAARRGETPDEQVRRLQRYDRLDDLLPTLAESLDVGDVLARLGRVLGDVVPHELLGLFLLEPDRRHALAYARAGAEGALDLPAKIELPRGMRSAPGWQFFLVDDLHRMPPDDAGPMPPNLAHLRSTVRVPVRIRGELVGGIAVASTRPAAYDDSHLYVMRRLADHVALAIAHQRLAAESRDAAALRERTAALQMLDGLLATLTDVLDISEVFDRVSQVVQPILPHDLMGVMEINEAGDRVHVRVTAGVPYLPTNFEAPVPPELFMKPWEALVIDDIAAHPVFSTGPSVKAGMNSALSIPIRFGGRLQAAVVFHSRQHAHFSREDLPVALRIAGHLALVMSHHRLAEEAKQRHALEERASALELLDHSLSLLTDGGKPDELFDRISAATQPLLPHDVLILAVPSADGTQARRYAGNSAAADLPETVDMPAGGARDAGWDHDLIADLSLRPEPHNAPAAERGFRSALRLPVRLEARFVGTLVFLSRTPSLYGQAHLQVARRVANRVAVAVERELGLAAARRAAEADDRAARLEARVRALTDELDARSGYRRVIGESPSWRQVLTQATQVAVTETTVLLLGESGTGKEVVARLLHRASARRDGPFVALNCAALPEHLLEAELFGYERGAFTGAAQSKPGQIEQAAGGVLFLDEVGEMTPSAQAKFLRVLQEREFQRLGGTRVLRADVRVVAATNRDLAKAIERGAFREDLYYRLNVFPIRLPPLRERRDDILPMSEAFMQEIGRSLGRPPAGLARDARQALVDYHWPGNVRELRNMIERAAILADGGLIVREHLALAPSPPPAAPPAAPEGQASELPLAERAALTEREAIEKALHDARFNKVKTAKALGLTRAQLYVRLKRHGLE